MTTRIQKHIREAEGFHNVNFSSLMNELSLDHVNHIPNKGRKQSNLIQWIIQNLHIVSDYIETFLHYNSDKNNYCFILYIHIYIYIYIYIAKFFSYRTCILDIYIYTYIYICIASLVSVGRLFGHLLWLTGNCIHLNWSSILLDGYKKRSLSWHGRVKPSSWEDWRE